MFYEFCSERQFVFTIEVDGKSRLVEFSERNQFGASVYQTADSKVADKIRQTSMVRIGQIVETTKITEAPQKRAIRKTITTPANEDPTTKSESGKEITEKTFPSITQAREFIVSTFGIPKAHLRKPETLSQVAEEHGIKLIIKQE
jgi:hypothetical protein